jgi:hypothetical protein
MTELSPAAQAVLDAANNAFDRAGTTSQGVAATLRAAVKQVAPRPALNPHAHAGEQEEAVSNAIGEILVELLDIAAELDPNTH